MSKKEKVIAPEKLAKIKQREAKELAKWQAEKAKPKKNFYLIHMFAICTVINLADEICSNLNAQMKSILATVFFEPVYGSEFAIARMDAFLMITFLFTGLAFLYKVLADRYGRKIFLIINTFGMGIAMILIGLATNIPVYLIGACLVTFFTPHDMQIAYVMESAPAKHRAKFCSFTKVLATLASMIIPAMRNLFITATDYSRWRMIYLLPSVIAFVAAVVAMLSLRETDAFIDTRIRQLSMSDEEKAAAKLNKKQDTTSRGGILNGIKFIFRHKQLLWLALGYGFLTFANNLTTNNEAILTMNYAQNYMASTGISLEDAKVAAIDMVSKALLLMPIGNALLSLAQGFVSDKIGRKPSAALFAVSCIVLLAGSYFAATAGMNPYIIGFLVGMGVAAYWSSNDNFYYLVYESCPTNLRTSVSSMFPIISGQFSLLSVGVITAMNNILGDTKIGLVALCAALPGVVISLTVLLLKVKETKGIDFSSIKGDEFEN